LILAAISRICAEPFDPGFIFLIALLQEPETFGHRFACGAVTEPIVGFTAGPMIVMVPANVGTLNRSSARTVFSISLPSEAKLDYKCLLKVKVPSRSYPFLGVRSMRIPPWRGAIRRKVWYSVAVFLPFIVPGLILTALYLYLPREFHSLLNAKAPLGASSSSFLKLLTTEAFNTFFSRLDFLVGTTQNCP
jgi:hypothetical protein